MAAERSSSEVYSKYTHSAAARTLQFDRIGMNVRVASRAASRSSGRTL